MNKRILGQTGLEINSIGFGGIPIQRIDQKTARQVVKQSIEKGINFFDTARGYTNSEELLGEALEPFRDQVYIATKSTVRDYEGMKSEIETSLKNLKTDYIDLYQFHFVSTMEQVNQIMGPDGAYKALVEAKNQGKIGHIGITSHSVDLLEQVLDMGVFETIQFPYNIIERQGEEVFKRAAEKNIGIIAMKPMAGGALENGELSLKFILQNPAISVAIAGMQSVDEVVKNTGVNDEDALTEVEKEEIEAVRKALGNNFCRRCGYCMPCPQGINIPAVFLFEGYLTRYDLADWAKDRYGAMAHYASECVECGACEPRCPYELPIREKMKQASQLFGR